MNVLAPIVAALLTAIAALHVYWGAGGVWPGRDGESLALTVVGGPIGSRMPSAFACHAVAVVLVAAAALVLGASGVVSLGLPAAWVRFGTLAVACVLGVRGLGGFFEQRLRPVIAGTPYARLNVQIYSPLALTLAAMTLGSLL